MTESTILQRQDVPPQSRWNATAVFPAWDEWLAEAEAVKAAAHALAEGVGNGRAGAVEGYLNFLKAGSSLYALDLFQTAGVDITKTAVVESAFAVLAGLVERLEGLAGG